MLSPDTLANGLSNNPNVQTETEAINNFVSAWISYFNGASASGIPISSSAVQSAGNVMKSAMTGLSKTGPAAIQSGIVAFWGALVPQFAVLFNIPPNVPTLLTPPPAISALAPLLLTVFTSNTGGKLDVQTANKNIASVIHTAQTGAIYALTTPAGAPITFPIL